MYRAWTVLKNADLFGVRPTVYFQGKKKFGTNFGCCLSLLLLTFTAVCFGYFGQDLYYRQNPSLRYNEEYDPLPQKIVIDPEITPIIIELDTPAGDYYFTDPRMVNFKISQWRIEKRANETIGSLVDYPLETCTEKHFQKLDGETKDYFLHKKLKDYFCIPLDIKNLTMEGAFDQNIFQAVKFTMTICQNGTGDVVCLPEEQIRSTMSRGFVGVYFVDYTINPSNYKTPKIGQPKEVYTNFVLNSQKQLDIMLRNNYIETEDGVVFQELKEDRVINSVEYREFDFKTNDPEFMWVYFKVKQQNSYYKRKYSKVQDLLAQIGGFVNCFYIFAFILNYLYSQLFIISQTLVEIFSIRITKRDLKQSTVRENNDPMENEKKFETESPDPYKYDSIKEIRLGFLDYVYYYTGCFGNEKRQKTRAILEKGSSIMQKCLDIKFMIKKFYELEKLKQLLLKEDEYDKFERLEKPNLVIEWGKGKALMKDSTISSFFGKKKKKTVPTKLRKYEQVKVNNFSKTIVMSNYAFQKK